MGKASVNHMVNTPGYLAQRAMKKDGLWSVHHMTTTDPGYVGPVG